MRLLHLKLFLFIHMLSPLLVMLHPQFRAQYETARGIDLHELLQLHGPIWICLLLMELPSQGIEDLCALTVGILNSTSGCMYKWVDENRARSYMH